ncbi:MAG TPA: 50S ribosomal protein L29 [Candidatus Omnitrophota bacterium]|nr:50S ribosomal protein L29 [Candidatus Omnitrophota bacterium]
MKIKELKDLSLEDLAAKEKQIKKELFGLNNQRQLGRVEKPALFKKAKKDIARILTVLNERKSRG